MKVLILNTHNPFKASGIVALDLFNQLRSREHDVKLLVNRYNKDYPDGIISLESSSAAWRKLIMVKIEWRINKLKRFLKIKEKVLWDSDYCFFQLNEHKKYYSTRKIKKAAGIRPDIIIVLYANKFINARNIYELCKQTEAKVFWLMYDMAPFTGGCHYAWDCVGYQNSCGRCPGLYSKNPFDVTFKNLNYKKKYLHKTNLQVLAGSEGQFQQAKRSILFADMPVHKMLIPVNSTVFKPVFNSDQRINLDVPIEKKVIFFGAVGLTERRKGMTYLVESLQILDKKLRTNEPNLKRRILLLVAGEAFDGIAGSLPFEYQYLGFLKNEKELASAYQASDIFLCPSIEDSGPMMINQSIMCGVPVVSFEIGVSLDLVFTGETGYRAKLKDSFDMAEGLYELLTLKDDEYSRISQNCRNLAMKLFSPEVHVQSLEKLMSN